MISLLLVLITTACVTHAAPRSAGKCCDGLGCFQTDGDFKHFPTPECPESYGVELAMYTRNNQHNPQLLDRTSAIPSQFVNTRRTIFVIHGFLNSGQTDYMIYIKDALLSKEDANVFLVDWQKGANNIWYPASASNTRTTGAEVALRADRLVNEAGLSPSNLWCVGFSLGAHACGFMGMYTELERITGLDPAGPWFDGYAEPARLNPSTAKLVDVMHTDGNSLLVYYGLLTPVGHVDYYPNGGRDQPGCFTNINVNGTLAQMDVETHGDISVSCSHMRAVRFFEKSILYNGCFTSRQICTNPRKLPSSCQPCSGICGEMGYGADKYSVKGILYLETSSKSPYCRY